MQNHEPLLPVLIQTNRLHETVTGGGSVARMIIHMFAPEAVRTVTATGAMRERLYIFATVLAGEGLLAGDKV